MLVCMALLVQEQQLLWVSLLDKDLVVVCAMIVVWLELCNPNVFK